MAGYQKGDLIKTAGNRSAVGTLVKHEPLAKLEFC